MKSITLPLSWLALAAMAGTLPAATITTNVAPAGTVLDCSSLYGGFPPSAIIDNSINEGTNATPVSYWIAANGVSKSYVTVDLHGTFPIQSIVLYNTHNRQSYDRGTGEFVVYGANAVDHKVYPGLADRYYPFEADLKDYSTNHLNGTFYDLLGNPLDPTVALSTEVPPLLTNSAHSLGFSGGGEFVEVLDDDQPSSYSISIWVKLQVVRACGIVLRTTVAGEQVSWAHQIRVTAAGKFEVFTYDGANKVVTGTTVIQPNTWYHVAATAQNGGFERLYVNGVEEGTPAAINTLWGGGDRWHVGSVYKGVNTPIVGQLDDLAIWLGPPLTPAMVARLAAGESPSTVTNTVGFNASYRLVNPQLLASGTLTDNTPGDAVLQPQTFAVSPVVTARYVQFQTLSSAYGNNNVGLNEMQVIAQVDPVESIKVAKAVFLSWPYGPFSRVLESSPSLVNPVWTTVTNTPTLYDMNWGLFLPATNTVYYRLITP